MSGTAERTISQPASSSPRICFDGGGDVAGVRLGHGLDGDGGVSADLDVADTELLGYAALHSRPLCCWLAPDLECSGSVVILAYRRPLPQGEGAAQLGQDAVAAEDAGHVSVAEDEDEHDDYGESHEVDQPFAFGGDALSTADPLYDDEEQAAAVEGGDGQDVDDAED